MYYEPDPTRAYESASRITNEVFLGELVRGMHKWGASLMIILIFLHMGRTFFFGAYKYPRELNWVIGVVLVILTMVMGLTGYLLPFDQRSFWATIVANNITASGPVVGPYLADFLRAGPDFSATTLSRFYALHMLAIPGLIGALTAVHLFLVVKLGTTAPPWVKAARPTGARPSEMLPAGVPGPETDPSAASDGAVTNGTAPEAPIADAAPAEEQAAEPTAADQQTGEATSVEPQAEPGDSPTDEGDDAEGSGEVNA